jgi:SH3-like domain-containing protein
MKPFLPHRLLCLARLSILASPLCAWAVPESVLVLADRVNLRAQSNLTSEVVGQVNYGDSLQALGFFGEWVMIAPPDGMGFWVHADFLHEDREVKVSTLNVRAGPGTNYSVVGQLKRGDAVLALETFQEWRRIQAPAGAAVWVNREYVQGTAAPTPLPPLPEPTLIPLPTPRPQPTATPVVVVRTVERILEVPVALPEPTPTAIPPGDMSLVPLEGQGSISIRRGHVRAYLLAGSSPSRFQLILRGDGGSAKAVAYLRGDENLIKSFEGKAVRVHGRDFWAAGQVLPVTVVESIEAVVEGN